MMIPSTSTRPDHQFDLQPCKYYRTLRWPWPLFGLLYGPIDVSSEAKRLIAGKLLKSDPEQLEHNTRKIRKICFDDLKHVSHSGCLPKGSLLHGILAISAQNLSLDAGELESLNSMIKTAASTYTNMSLELLSSRVNARKTLTLAACGSRTFKDLKSIAASLANVSPLYQGCEKEIMNDAFEMVTAFTSEWHDVIRSCRYWSKFKTECFREVGSQIQFWVDEGSSWSWESGFDISAWLLDCPPNIFIDLFGLWIFRTNMPSSFVGTEVLQDQERQQHQQGWASWSHDKYCFAIAFKTNFH